MFLPRWSGDCPNSCFHTCSIVLPTFSLANEEGVTNCRPKDCCGASTTLMKSNGVDEQRCKKQRKTTVWWQKALKSQGHMWFSIKRSNNLKKTVVFAAVVGWLPQPLLLLFFNRCLMFSFAHGEGAQSVAPRTAREPTQT